MDNDAMNWNVILKSLTRASEELERLHCRMYYLQFCELPEDCMRRNDESCLTCIARQEEHRQFDEGCLFVGLEQVYTHLNFAWNCRRMSEVGIKNINERDCKKRMSFPKTAIFDDLWPPDGIVKSSMDFSASHRKIHLFPLRPEIHVAKRKLSNLCLFVARECFGTEKVVRPNGMPDDVWNQRLTEKYIARRLRIIYYRLNMAWNSRMRDSYPKGARAIRACECFPTGFFFECHNANEET